MNMIDNPVVTEIMKPLFVFSEKGRVLEMKNRKHFGISFCEEGKITYVMNGKKYVSHPGNAVLLPKGGNYTLIGEIKGIFPVINFECTGLDLSEITEISISNSESCIKICKKIQNHFLYDQNRYRIFSSFYELLDLVFTSEERQNPLIPAISFIEKHISDPDLTNAVLAKYIGFSEVYTRKLFIKHYHITPKQFILELRLRKAKQLLSDTSLPVSVIAEASGFSCVYHFSRAFKEKVGMTPTEFANHNRSYEI